MKKIPTFCVLIPLLFLTGTLSAESKPSWTSIRLAMPLWLQTERVNTIDNQFGNALGIYGIRLSHQFSSQISAELGTTRMWTVTTLWPDAFARVGYAFQLFGPTASDDRGWRSFATPLVGYRYAMRGGGVARDNSYDISHSVQVGGAFDLMYGRRHNLAVRLFLGGNVAIVSNQNDVPFDSSHEAMKRSFQLGLSIGYATSFY